MKSEDPHEFKDEESITANLRLRSLSPQGRFFLGAFMFIPRVWRGPVAIIVILIVAYVLVRVGPTAVKWVSQ